MKRFEFKEVKVPQDLLDKLQQSAIVASQDETGEARPLTLGQAGVFDWLTRLSKEEGWCPVWETYQFPYIVLQREIAD